MKDPIISEELFSKRITRNRLDEELKQIASEEEKIAKAAKKKTNKYFWFFWVASGMQLGASYHGIYNVEWLGWDLVEPLTYTSSMGVSVFFMWYMLRNRGLEDTRN